MFLYWASDFNRRNYIFDGDYNKVIGNNKQKFLKNCDSYWDSKEIGVACVDVFAGSIFLTLEGNDAELDKSERSMRMHGLVVPGFGLWGVGKKNLLIPEVDQ